MEKHKITKRTFWALLLVGVMACCVSEDDYRDEEKKPVEPLTISNAQAWYEENFGMKPGLKSISDETQAMFSPQWQNGQLFSDSNWYVVESPMEFSEKKQLKFTTNTVSDYINNQGDFSAVKQIQQLVVMRNKHTGVTCSFIMFIVPELEYMNSGTFDENNFVIRNDDLDGLVLYYTVEGDFMNGWVYEKGKLTSALIKEGNSPSMFRTKSLTFNSRYCYGFTELTYVDDGEPEYISGVMCKGNWGWTNDPIDREDVSGPGGPSFENIGIYQGTGGYNNSNNSNNQDKKPEKRTDCSGSATQNANNAQNAQKAPNVLVNMNFLREYAKGKENEWSMLIDSQYGSYKTSELKEGRPGSASLRPNANTVYDVHTHNDDKREGYNVYTGFSVGDIYGTFDTSYEYSNYKGCIVIAYDGSEYLLAVDDRERLQKFWGNTTNRDLFKSGDNTIFKDGKMNQDYEDIRRYLDKQGYSVDDAHDYALSYLLDKYFTGLKISKKEKGENSFKETKTEKSTTNEYKPTKCP